MTSMVQVSSYGAVLAFLLKVGNRFYSSLARCRLILRHVGRTIMGDQALRVFASVIPALAQNLLYASHDAKHISDFIDCIEDQEDLRAQTTAAGLRFRSSHS